MKTTTLRILTIVAGFFLLTSGAFAQSGTWTNAEASVWSEPTNWLNGIIANGAGNVATFSNEFSTAVEVNMNTPRTVGGLQFLQGIYTITNDNNDAVNILTFEGATKPLIDVDAALGTPATLRRVVLAGTNGFVLDGGGQLNVFKATLLTVDSSNTWSGDVILSNGTFQIQGDDINAGGHTNANNLVLGGLSSTAYSWTFYNGSVLNLLSDPSDAPSYGAAHMNLIVPEGHSGTVVLPPRFAGTSGTGGSGMNGTLTGGGTLNLQTRFVRGNIGGNWSAFTGQINVTPQVNNSEWRFGNAAGFPSASVDLGGTLTLIALYYPAPAADNTTVIPIGLLTGANPAARLNGSGTAGRTLTFRIGAKQTNSADTAFYSGSLVNGAGPSSIVWEGAGTWVVVGTNTHSGGTTISSGTLQIGDGGSESGSLGTGPVTNQTALVIARGGTMTVPGVITGPGSVTLSGGATIRFTGANTYTGPTAVTAGKLILGPGSTASGAYSISDFAGLGAVLTASNAAVTINGNATYGTGSSFDVELGTFGNPSVPAATNTGNITLNGDVTVNVLGTNFNTGTITLLQYLGTRSGGGAFVLGSLPPHILSATLNDDTANKRVTLTITAVNAFNPTLRWVGDVLGLWDFNTANQVWREVGSGQLTNYYDGPPVLFDDTATGTTAIDVTTTVSPSFVTVSNVSKAYTFGGFGSIDGAGGLTKQGSNKLTITNANSYAGLTYIESGVVQVGTGEDPGTLGAGGVTNRGSLIVIRTNALAVTMTGDITGPGSITIPGLDTTNTIVLFSPTTGSTYTGGTSVTNATIEMGNAVANSLGNDGTGLGTGTNTFWGNSELRMFQYAANAGDNGFDFNPILNVPAGQTLTYRWPGRCREASTLLGSGTVNLVGRWVRCYGVGNWSQFAGQINFYGANVEVTSLRLNDTFGMPLARVHLLNPLDNPGAVVRLMNQGDGELLYRIGALSGDAGTFIEGDNGDGNDPAASTVWVVGGLNTDATFAGTTADSLQAGPVHSFVKEGTGRWTLSGTNLHSGFTTVSNGVLALVADTGLSNSVRIATAGSGTLSVTGRTDLTLFVGTGSATQTLGGDGTVQGNVVLGALGRLEPGFSVGTLTVSGNASLGGTNVMELTTTGGAASDRLVAANINYASGTLILTNIGNITGTNVFQLFSGSISGTFANVITQSLSGVTWNLSQLNVNGTVTLVGPTGPSTTPTNITSVVVGNTLQLSWPSSHTGWTLQNQTNALNVGLSGTWFDVAGSTATNQVFVPINPANPTVFYRLTLPTP